MKRYFLLLFLCAPLFATVNVRDYGALGNGTDDDTTAINSAFSTACAASDNVYLPAGTYLINSLDQLNGCGISFYGDGPNNSILKLRSVISPTLWRLSGGFGKSVTIRDLSLDGGHLEGAGIAIEQYQAVTISRVSIHDFGTPGYAQGHRSDYDGLYIRNVESVQITDSQSTGNERAGIELQAVHNSTVSNSVMSRNGGMGGVSEQNFDGALDGPLVAKWVSNTLANNGSGGIDVETDPALPPAQGILQSNRVIDCGNNNWGSGWGLVIGMHSFGTIEGNEVNNFAAQVAASDYSNAIVYGSNGGPIQILNNTVNSTKVYGILGSSGLYPVTIMGNRLSGNGTGIFIYSSPGVQILNNTVSNSGSAGISVYWSDGSTIGGNQFSANNPDLMIDGQGSAQ